MKAKPTPIIQRNPVKSKEQRPVIVLLSSRGSALLPSLLQEFDVRGISAAATVLDGEVSERDRNMQSNRTKGFFEWPNFADVGRYNIPQYDVSNHNSDDSGGIL